MSVFDSAIQQFRKLPRAMRWVVYAAVGFALFLTWDGWIAPTTQELRDEADAIQAKVQEVRNASALIRQFDMIDDEITSIGPVQLPASQLQGRQAIQQVINDTLKNYSITEPSFSITDNRVRSGTLATVTGTRRLASLKVDLEFIAAPDVAMSIIAEFEANPEIEFIRTLRLTKAPGKKVKVRMTLESWVLGQQT